MLQSNYSLVCASVRTLSRYTLLGPSECSLVSTARHASIGSTVKMFHFEEFDISLGALIIYAKKTTELV